MPISTESIVEAVRNVTGTRAVIQPDTDLFRDRILDSLAFMELVIYIADKTGLDLPPAGITRAQWKTVDDIVTFLNQKHGSGKSGV